MQQLQGPMREVVRPCMDLLTKIALHTRLALPIANRYVVRSCVAAILISSFRPDSVGSYLVDPASGHMLVSKIKPCMSKHELY